MNSGSKPFIVKLFILGLNIANFRNICNDLPKYDNYLFNIEMAIQRTFWFYNGYFCNETPKFHK